MLRHGGVLAPLGLPDHLAWTLTADPFLLSDDPMLPVAVLRLADDRCLTVPDTYIFLIPEL